MMKRKMGFILVAILSLLGTQARADVVCTASAITGNQESPPSATVRIPSEGAISGSATCNGYRIYIDCDFHYEPTHLSLKIVGPQGSTVSTSTEQELKLVDESGNGASVSCADQE